MRIFRSWFVSPYWANLPVLDFSTPRRNYARNGHSHKIPTKTTSHNLVAMTICKLDDKEHYQLTIYNNGVKSQYFHCFLKCAPADTKLLFLLVIFLGGLSGIGHKLLGLLVLHVHYATQVLATPTRRQALASLVLYTTSVFRFPIPTSKNTIVQRFALCALFLGDYRESNPNRRFHKPQC